MRLYDAGGSIKGSAREAGIDHKTLTRYLRIRAAEEAAQ
jgi:hypothetical protein